VLSPVRDLLFSAFAKTPQSSSNTRRKSLLVDFRQCMAPQYESMNIFLNAIDTNMNDRAFRETQQILIQIPHKAQGAVFQRHAFR
jgi:hypothetical protein